MAAKKKAAVNKKKSASKKKAGTAKAQPKGRVITAVEKRKVLDLLKATRDAHPQLQAHIDNIQGELENLDFIDV